MVDKIINGSLDVTGEISQNGHSIAPQINVTWAELKALRDGGTLVPGQQYRITDYQCTTTMSRTSSAGHQFDIIVTADSTDKLNEIARACLHVGDTYFTSNKLEAWQLRYTIDNDTDKFSWADATNGKGVIYRMIDEFNNDCPYDFKNILFTTYPKYTSAYTFSYTESSTIKDASLLGLNKKCYNNVMKEYTGTYTLKKELNFNVFYTTGTDFECYSNIFGSACHDNTFGSYCYNNTFGDGCASNTFSSSCGSNTFGKSCNSNTFGNGSSSNIFGGVCTNNTFGSGCSDNIFITSCSSNKFGNNCGSNTFGIDCRSNTLGVNCVYNTFGDYCTHITFGDSSSSVNYCQNILLDNNCRYLYINSTDTSASSSNYLQNVHVHLGVSGSSSSNRKTLTVPDRNLAYETNFIADGSNDIIV